MSKKNRQSKDPRCPSGYILRDGYLRKAYVKKTGVHIPESYVKETCIIDRGKPGKGPKTLPRPDNLVHLRDYGYSYKKSDADRHRALRDAAKDTDTLLVLRRMNLLRNYQAIPEIKDVFSEDVDYMSKFYQKEKNKRLKIKQRGGIKNNESESISDSIVDELENETNESFEQSFSSQKICDESGNCEVIKNVYEKHSVNGSEVIFYTLNEDDAEDIFELDQKLTHFKETLDEVKKRLVEYYGWIIGIKVNNKLEGYCHYEELTDKIVTIIWFYANKSYSTPLYTFMEKYFLMNDYQRIQVVINLNLESAEKLNFWNKMDFNIDREQDKFIYLSKLL